MPEDTGDDVLSMRYHVLRGVASKHDDLTAHQCIDCLLQRTDVGYWRRGLLEIIQNETRVDNLHQLIIFLTSNISNSIAARKQGPRTLVHIDYQEAPNDLDLMNWRRIILGLNIVLEEPDTNRNIRYISVSVAEATDARCLRGFQELLSCLRALSRQMVGFILALNKCDASAVYETLMDTTIGFPIPEWYSRPLTSLYEQHVHVMRTLGFYRRSPVEPITWTRPERGCSYRAVMGVIHGLCKVPSGVQESRTC